MSRINQQATITLSLNGTQAADALNRLKAQAVQLKKDIQAAAAAGDKVTMRKLQGELTGVNKQIRQVQGAAVTAEQTLRHLDTATPKELNQTLKALTKELNNIERGSAAWDEQCAKIRAVRDELRQVREATRGAEPQLSGWEKLKDTFSGMGLGIAAGVLSIGEVTSKLTEAVERYASMQQEMANVSKFSGLAEEQVKQLNEELKKIDTRTSREELNRLAQEAGRLGKSSVEDILGFVRAADVLNVALDDLGEGATLTLSKLTGIFGIEGELGTERSLLAVGSVINELSQSSAASAPYIAEFASRLGGVGAQARMSISDLMAYGAVLDANEMNVEAASTALAQLITRMFRDPANYAQAAGLEVKKFSELLKTDANAALMLFLETLGKAGNLDVLAPMFADMGENGSRSVAVLTTLSGHIADVRAQQELAAQAFSEGSSVITEFNVQNNTLQARLEKTRNALNENYVTLGEQLTPVVEVAADSLVYLSGTFITLLRFLSDNKGALLASAVALGIFTAAVKAQAIAMGVANVVMKTGTALTAAWRAVTLLGSAAMNLFSGHAARAAVKMRQFNAAMSSNVIGAVVVALGFAIGKLAEYIRKSDEARRAEQERKKELRELAKATSDLSEATTRNAEKELTALRNLYSAATNEAEAKEKRITAAKRLLELYPSQFKNMSAEDIMLGKAKNSYDALTKSIIANAKAKAAAELYQQNQKKLLELELDLEKNRSTYREADKVIKATDAKNEAHAKALNSVDNIPANAHTTIAIQGAMSHPVNTADEERKARAEAGKEIDRIKEEQKVIRQSQRILEKNNAEAIASVTLGTTTETDSPGGFIGGGGGSDKKNRKGHTPTLKEQRDAIKETEEFKTGLQKLQTEREEAETLLRTQRVTGAIDYRQYIDSLFETEQKYYQGAIDYFKEKIPENLKPEQDKDLQNLIKEKGVGEKSHKKEVLTLSADVLKRQRDAQLRDAEADFKGKSNPTLADEMEHNDRVLEIKLDYFRRARELYKDDMEKLHAVELEEEKTLDDDRLASRERLMKQVRDLEAQAATQTAAEKYEIEKAGLQKLLDLKVINQEQFDQYLEASRKKIAKDSGLVSRKQKDPEEKKRLLDEAKGALDAGLISKSQYAERVKEIEKEFAESVSSTIRGTSDDWGSMAVNLYQTWSSFFASLKDKSADWKETLSAALSATAAAMGAVTSQVAAMTEADMKRREARIKKYYSKEIELAEGNSAKVRQLERDRDEQITSMRRREQKKTFALQVATALAQTAANAISAYGAGLQVGGLAGLILAPIAAAMAVAAGMVQVATIKKQQQAGLESGYMQGGYTRSGRKDEEVGVVHAGEWVAPADMVSNPRSGAIIRQLEIARRNNTYGTLSAADVSMTVTAPVRRLVAPMVAADEEATESREAKIGEKITQGFDRLSSTMERLDSRLKRPFTTIATVAGDKGINKAQREYDRLMRNKSK